MKARFWKVKGIRRGIDKGNCPLCLGNEGAKRILLSCPETKGRRMEFLCKKWLIMNEELPHRKVKRTNRTRISNVGKHIDRIRRKWGKELRWGECKLQKVLDMEGTVLRNKQLLNGVQSHIIM
jgi:hypothetical protein